MLTSRLPFSWGILRLLTSDSMRTSSPRFCIQLRLAREWCGRATWRYRLCLSRRTYSGTRTRTLRSCTGFVKVGVYVFFFFLGGALEAFCLMTVPVIAISKISTKAMEHIRDDLMETCTATLLGYRRNCAQSSGITQVRRWNLWSNFRTLKSLPP